MSQFLYENACTSDQDLSFYSSMDDTASPKRNQTHPQSDEIFVVSESDGENTDKSSDIRRPLNFRKHLHRSNREVDSDSSMDDNGSIEKSWREDAKGESVVIDSESDEEGTGNVVNVGRTSSFRGDWHASGKGIQSDYSMHDEGCASVEQSWADPEAERIVIDSESDEKETGNIVDIRRKSSLRKDSHTRAKAIYSDSSMHDEDCASVEQSRADPKTERIVIDSDSDDEKPRNVFRVGRMWNSATDNSTNSENDWSDSKDEKIVLDSESDEETIDNRVDFRKTMDSHREKLHKDTRLFKSMAHDAPVEQGLEYYRSGKILAESDQLKVENIAKCLLSPPIESQKAENPKGLKTQLMPHQQEALFWLIWREQQKPSGGVLADDMGLGKTLTMISLIVASKEQNDHSDDSDRENTDNSNWNGEYRGRGVKGHTLVICPASLLVQWVNEIKNRCKKGVLTTMLYHGSNRERSPKLLGRYDVVITTYNIAGFEFKTLSTLFKIKWQRIILDEAHIIRNHKTRVSQAVCGLSATKRWALTGTPIHNKELDLYSILKFLQCSPFDDLGVWKRWMDNKNTSVGRNRLATVMKSLMLRRMKEELQDKGLLNGLPLKAIEQVDVELDDEEQLVYEKVLIFSRTLFAQFLAQRVEKEQYAALDPSYYNKHKFLGRAVHTEFTKAQNELLSLHADVKTHEILVLLLRLRQICCHPSLIHAMLDQEDVEGSGGGIEDENVDPELLSKMNSISLESAGEESTNEKEIGVDSRVRANILTSKNPVFDRDRLSSKIKAVFRVTRDILKTDDKLVIVSEWATMLDIIASCLETTNDATFAKLTGSVPVKDRQAIIDTFNAEDNTLRILLLSLTAGGVGLNLVGANHLLLVDVHWNPQLESQAQDRVYRFGQEKNVFVYKFICKNTIEERIKQLQDRKLELANSILSGVKNSNNKLTINDLKSLFCM